MTMGQATRAVDHANTISTLSGSGALNLRTDVRNDHGT
ncbi:unannotated protein [freshwater metagenome]|uniref:Unannotated protein n=1 Tax=freshwater metagenome TaxID=449393 RepID=A0A6J7JRD0_9ZZZZ